MVLRGQGDSPVRICDPCKKLEEAARFELRHRHRNRAGKGAIFLKKFYLVIINWESVLLFQYLDSVLLPFVCASCV